jgi:hypothetical protein
MSENGRRRELKKFSPAITRRLAAQGYKIVRGYAQLPTVGEIFAAIERAEPLWVYQCWLIVRKTRQRAPQARGAPTGEGRDANRAMEEGGEKNQGGEEP